MVKFGRLRAEKLLNHVDFGKMLAIEAGRKKHFFRLRGLIAHYGSSMDMGHYVATVRQPDGSWAHCDDSSVSTMKEEDVFDHGRGAPQVAVLGYDFVRTEEVGRTSRL
jgi:hypothetical protein